MRILMGTLSYKPNVSGVAVTVELLANYLIEQGHQVTIVAPARSLRSSVSTDPATGATIYRVRALPNPARRGFFIPIFTGSITRRIIKEVKPDIIHVHDPLAMCRYLYLAGRRQSVPTVVSNHFMFDYIGAYLPKLLRPIVLAHLRRKFINFYNQCQVVVAPSQTVVDYLRTLGVKPPMFALSNGVDIERFFAYLPVEQTRQAYHLPANLPLVLYLGRLDSDKSLDILIHAFAKVYPQIPCHLALVGAGGKQKKLSELINQLSLSRSVTFTGPVPHHSLDLVALYQAADIFVMPSSIETQSVTTLEAMATGKPVIAANGGALPELINDGVNGLLFKAGDSDDLAEKLTKLLPDQILQAQLASAAVVTATSHELKKRLKLFEELYTSTIAAQKNDA